MFATEFAETRARLTTDEKWYMLGHLLHFPSLFQFALHHLKSEFFSEPDEPHLRLLWKTVNDVARSPGGVSRLFTSRHHAMSLVTTLTKATVHNAPESMPTEYYDQLFSQNTGGIIWWIYSGIKEELTEVWGNELLTRFMEERYVQDYLRTKMTVAGSSPLTNLPILLREIQDRRSHIDNLSVSPIDDAFNDEWTPTPVNKYTTGIPWLDGITNGGHVAGETYGILGGFGSGKTTIGAQIVVGSARYAADRHKSFGDPLKYAYLCHYEAGKDEMRCRMMSHAASIDKNVLEMWGKPNFELSKTGSLKAYEKELFADQIKAVGEANFMGEHERFLAHRSELKSNIRLLDMSGPEHNPKQGSGYIPEIVSALERDRREGREPSVVVIDYAGLCVRRHIIENNLEEHKFYTMLTDFGHNCFRQIAVPFKTPVWILHQLSGDANTRTFASKITHADAAGSKSFAENLWFSFQIGMPHPEHRAMQFFCTKARRADIGKPTLLQIKYPVSTVVKSENWVVSGNELVPKEKESVVASHPTSPIMNGQVTSSNQPSSPVSDPNSNKND